MKALVFVLLISAAAGVLLSSCTSQGRSDAQADLRAGKLVVETAGMPMPGEDRYHELMKTRYGVEHRRVADCVLDDKTIAHMKAYNEVMSAEITKKFGEDVFARTIKEAERTAP